MSVAIIGTVAFDSIETPRGVHDRILGGSATYAGIAASLYSPVHLISIVGSDFPQVHFDYFKERGISTQGIHRSEGLTFHWKGFYKKDMNQAHTVQTDLNVLLEFDPVVPEAAANSRIVFLANIDPVLQRKAIGQFNSPELVVMDSMNYWIEDHLTNLKETLKLVDVLILNDQEIRLLTGIDNVIQALPHVIAMGPKRVIVKKGEHGAVMYNGKDYFAVPALPLDEVVDPTGAGDSFAGGIVGYLAKSPTLDDATFQKALLVGTLISSFTVRDFSLGALDRLSIDTIMNEFMTYKSIASIPENIE
jgi:sugar/nucleoside kinase (ribokinase family)